MIRLGPGGTAGLGYDQGFAKCKELGLTALEVEFTYGVKMSIAEAERLGKIAKEFDIALSCHAPYYINLCSEEKEKIVASKQRIIDSCQRAHALAAQYVVFHAGFYGKKTKEETYSLIKSEIEELLKKIKENKFKVELALETTGKASQFGDLDELLRMRKETGSSICVDFAHILARTGKIDYQEVFDKLKPLQHIQSHFSGINYTAKGERNHIITGEKVIIPLIEEIKKKKVDITIINESPEPFEDSVKTKKILEK